MSKLTKKRLKEVSEAVGSMPISPEVEEEAFQRFKETGELPEFQRLAGSVIDRALRGGVLRGQILMVDRQTWLNQINRVLERLGTGEPEPQPLRKMLFHEAVYGPKYVSIPARVALRILVDMGRDVTDPEFIPTDTEIPDWGSVGWHLTGLPNRLIKAPYEEQTRRLFGRFDDLRERIDRDDQEWMDAYGQASLDFMRGGELPEDELMAEAVLANGEFFEVLRQYHGIGDAEVMAAFDRYGTGQESQRGAVMSELQELAAQGRMASGPEYSL